MRHDYLIAGLLFWIALGSSPSEAQYTADFQTNIISGGITNWSGDYIVGSNTFGDALLIRSSGVLTNANGYLGYEVGGSNNSALVADPGSLWSNRLNLYVGFSGANNSLVISNGGRVVALSGEQLSSGGYVGYNSSSSNNQILVTDPGSSWSNYEGALYLGYTGAGNSLVIRNGGQVQQNSSYIGYGPKTNSNIILNGSNTVLVSDTGSVWTNWSNLYLGYGMGGNSFVLSNGARTFDSSGYMGYNSSTNSAWVSGPGSIWSNSGSFYVGYSGGQNSLFIDHSGQVVCAQSSMYVGYNAQSTGNSVTISGPGSTWKCPFLISVGWSGSGNSLVISNGGLVSAAGGCAIGGSGGASNNNVLVTDVSSVFSNNNLILGGSSGGGNSLVVSNGGQMVCGGYTYLGEYGGGSSVRVTGPGSAWTSGGEVYMGFFTASNTLTVTEGASVRSSSAWLGINGGANSNVALVSGPGSVWSNDTLLTIGWTTANSVIVSNGGALVSTSIQAGYSGSSNSLIIAGGSVVTTNLIIGAASSSCDHRVELDAGSLTVTNATHDATLEVRDGQLVINAGSLEVDLLIMNTPCGLYVRNGGIAKIHRLVTNQTQDSVGDGIPDLWRKVYFGGDGTTTNNQSCATCDPDGDGFSNLQEYLMGTDPTDSSSTFRITNIAREGDDIRVTWMTPAGWTNALQATPGAAVSYGTNGFQNIFILTNTVSGLTNYLDVGAATNVPSRFYRVWLMPSWAGVHFVDLNSTNPVSPYATPATAATNIQDAVAVSAPADLVLVTNGVYQTGLNTVSGTLTCRVAITQPITVQSVNGPVATVIDGGGVMRCLYITNGVSFSGFTLTNGAADVGAGVWCESPSSVVSNCVMVGNTAETGNGYGGAAYQGTLNNCVLSSNSAWWGGGVYSSAVNNCTLSGNWGNLGGSAYGSTLIGCILSSNATPNGGGGAYLCTLNNCLLATNSGNWAGGAWDCTLTNCTLTGNSSSQVGGGAFSCTLNNCTLSYNFVGSDAVTLQCCGWSAGGGAAFSTLNNCLLLNNAAHVYIIYETDGGGAYNCSLNNCLVIGNYADGAGAGGGGGLFGGTANVCTVVGNSSGYYAGGGGIQGTTVNNCIIVNNKHQGVANNYNGGVFAFTCTSPVPYGRGNIDVNPIFVNSGAGDYHLQTNSPCINAGNNDYVTASTDFDGNPRVVGGTVDLGAYEFQSPKSLISYAWLQQYGLPIDGSADFVDSDGNGVSNWQKWMTGIDPTNSQSLFRIIDISEEGDDVQVTWELGWGAVNSLQVSGGDTRGGYTTNGFTDIAIVTNYGYAETVTNYLDVGAATNGPSRYYRVRLVP
jgi:T5SS/PEP-CTERM-associated repeat protein